MMTPSVQNSDSTTRGGRLATMRQRDPKAFNGKAPMVAAAIGGGGGWRRARRGGRGGGRGDRRERRQGCCRGRRGRGRRRPPTLGGGPAATTADDPQRVRPRLRRLHGRPRLHRPLRQAGSASGRRRNEYAP